MKVTIDRVSLLPVVEITDDEWKDLARAYLKARPTYDGVRFGAGRLEVRVDGLFTGAHEGRASGTTVAIVRPPRRPYTQGGP